MKNFIAPALIVLALAGCATQTGMPMGNNLARIDISAAPVYGRAGAQKMAFQQAAKTTLELGYDKFIVQGNDAWNENGASGGSYGHGQFNSFGGSANSGGFFSTHRNPESSMIIRMYHYKDAGARNAVDARAVLAAAKK